MTGPAGSSALSHLRVLDLTRARAGPTCCRILADFGADVLKIDAPPGVDPNEGMSGARSWTGGDTGPASATCRDFRCPRRRAATGSCFPGKAPFHT